jgi:hypothetical protein
VKTNDAFPSNYLSKTDFAQPALVTLTDVVMLDVNADDGKPKPVMYVVESDKGLILNRSNWSTLAELFGDDSDLWRGRKIVVFHDPGVMFGGKRVGGLRLRAPKQAQATPRPTVAPPPAPVQPTTPDDDPLFLDEAGETEMY